MKFLLLCSTPYLNSEIFQVHGGNWPMVNILAVDFRSQSDCSIFRKEWEKENE